MDVKLIYWVNLVQNCRLDNYLVFRIAEIMNKDVCNYVENSRRIPTEYSSLLRNVQNRFRSKSKAKEPEPQELDDFGTR
jgi:hypothetical protein